MPVEETAPPVVASPNAWRLAVELAPGQAALRPHRLRRGGPP